MRGLYSFSVFPGEATARGSCLPLSMHTGPQTRRQLLVSKEVFRNFFLTLMRMFLKPGDLKTKKKKIISNNEQTINNGISIDRPCD